MTMFRKGLIGVFLITALSAQAQPVDDNWDGPDVPEIKRVPGGGIEYTGKWYARRTIVKRINTYEHIKRGGFPRAIILIDSEPRAIMTKKSLSAIDRYYGGDGHVPAYEGEIEIFNPDVWADEDRTSKLPEPKDNEISLDEIPARGKSIDLSTVAAENGPIELFSDEEIGAINPQDGIWVSSVDSVTATGCPPGVESAGVGMMGLGQTRSITFTQPWWHPSDISAEFGDYSWRPVGVNGYFSTAYETGPEAAGSGMSLTVTMALNVKSQTRINYWGRIKMNLAPHLAAIAGGSETCTAVVTGSLQKQG